MIAESVCVTCPSCGWSGRRKPAEANWWRGRAEPTCPKCGGSGMRYGKKKERPLIPVKIGTVPMLVVLKSRRSLVVGDKVEFRENDASRNVPWSTGIVTDIAPLKIARL